MAVRLAYLGPPGTFSEQAALTCDLNPDLRPAPSITAAARAVAKGAADYAIVPIENSLEGSVPETLDLLIHELDLCISREVVLWIQHCLVAPPDIGEDGVRRVYSHPQALAQCRDFLARELPQAAPVAAISTAHAVEAIMERTDAAAVAPRRAAEIHGAAVLREGVEDDPRNRTRFVVLGHEDAAPTGDDKTSIVLHLADRPGALARALQCFARASINLTKIESRPAREELGVYVFLLDFAGHRSDPPVAAVLDRVRCESTKLKVLGSYPRFQATG